MEPTAQVVQEAAQNTVGQLDNWNEAFGLSSTPQTMTMQKQQNAVIGKSPTATVENKAAWGNEDSNLDIDEV